jgi:hypothetical protein
MKSGSEQRTLKTLWGEFANKIWSDSLKPYLDFRSFLNQRALILATPSLDFGPEVTERKEWKGPLGFAIQATLVSVLLVSLVSSAFGVVFKPPQKIVHEIILKGSSQEIHPRSLPVGSSLLDFVIEQAKRDLADLRSRLSRIELAPEDEKHSGPPPYAVRPNHTLFMLRAALSMSTHNKIGAERLYKDEIAKVEDQLSEYEFTARFSSASAKVKSFVPAVWAFLAAFIFTQLTYSRARDYVAKGREHEFFLYYVVGRLFWIVVFVALLDTFSENLELYLPADFRQQVADLEKALSQIDGKQDWYGFVREREFWFGLAFVGVLVWWYVEVRVSAWKLLPAFGLVAATQPWHVFSGEKRFRKLIIFAIVLPKLLILLLIWLMARYWPSIRELLSSYQL